MIALAIAKVMNACRHEASAASNSLEPEALEDPFLSEGIVLTAANHKSDARSKEEHTNSGKPAST